MSCLLCVACDDDAPDTTTDGGSSSGDATGESSDGAECMSNDDCEGSDVCADGTCLPPSSWAVGDGGLVVQVSPDGAAPHPAGLSVDLNAITCFERSQAWFVGDGGALGYTDDGGASWRALESPTSRDLLDVASIEPLRVAVSGADGALMVSEDGASFVAIPGPEGVTLGGVEVTPFRVLAVDDSGAIWRHERDAVAAVVTAQAAAPLRAIDIGDHGSYGAAVGDAGTMLWSEDGGETWTPVDTGTQRGLLAVQVAMDGSAAVAVGQGGIVVRLEGGEVTTAEVASVDLHALHLSHTGFGVIVGAQGTALWTGDAGRGFTVIDTGLSADLTGVDALGERHW